MSAGTQLYVATIVVYFAVYSIAAMGLSIQYSYAGVVNLAFIIMGGPTESREVNLKGSRNLFEATVAAGVRRLVYASSVAAYGFHSDNPVGMTEDWPVRPAARRFYAQQKAELEHLLQA